MVFKDLGTFDDILKLVETENFRLVCAKNKIRYGKPLYTCKTHKGFNVIYDSGINLGYVCYTLLDEKEFRDIFLGGKWVTSLNLFNIINIINFSDPAMKHNNIHILSDRGTKVLIITENNEVCCLIGIDKGIDLDNGLYNIEQNDDYILIHLVVGSSILVDKSDYSSDWADRSLRLC